jgi:hypothetical protein
MKQSIVTPITPGPPPDPLPTRERLEARIEAARLRLFQVQGAVDSVGKALRNHEDFEQHLIYQTMACELVTQVLDDVAFLLDPVVVLDPGDDDADPDGAA